MPPRSLPSLTRALWGPGGSPLSTDGDIEDQIPVTEDFQGLQVEAMVHADGLRGLSRELCRRILAGLAQALREEPALETLEEAVSSLGGQVGWVGPAPARRAHPPHWCVPSWSRACAVAG